MSCCSGRGHNPRVHGGGVVCYISRRCNGSLISPVTHGHLDLDLEVLWLLLRPKILPRPLSCIIVAIVYAPPWYSVQRCKDLRIYMLACIDYFRAKYVFPGFIVCGDFNSFNTDFLYSVLHFRQKVNKPTRGGNILDKLFTNLQEYNDAVILPPIGRSDHNCVLVIPSMHKSTNVGAKTCYKRDLSPSVCEAISKELINFNWTSFYLETDVQIQADMFYEVLFNLVDRFAPMKCYKFKNNDRPWVTQHFKDLVLKRNLAFRKDDTSLYHQLRNKVNRLRKILSKSFVERKIIKKGDKVGSGWWRDIKLVCGIKSASVDTDYFKGIKFLGNEVSYDDVPYVINAFLKNISDGVPCLRPGHTECDNNWEVMYDAAFEPDVSEIDVYHVLEHLKVSKASLDSSLNNRMLKNMSAILAAPICALINNSLRQGIVPSQWKIARISPIRKSNVVRDIEKD